MSRVFAPFFPRSAAIVCAGLGCAAQVLAQSALWTWAVYAAMAALAVLAMWAMAWAKLPRPAHRVAAIAMAALCATLGFAATGWRAAALAEQALPAAWTGPPVTLTGTVHKLPQRRAVGGWRWVFAVDGAWLHADGRVLAADGAFPRKIALTSAEPLPIAPGQRWQFTARLRPVSSYANVRGLDTALWWWTQGVRATGHVGAGAQAVLLGDTHAAPLQRWRHAVRERMNTQMASSSGEAAQVSADAAGIVTALVTGDQAAISAAQWQLWRTTGVVHLVSISGLHITMFAWAAMVLVRGLWGRSATLVRRVPARLAGLWVGLALAALYAAFSGWGLPAQRTLLMLAALVALRSMGLRWPWPRVWAVVLAVIVIWQPWALLQAGLWLSFIAVAVLFGLEKPKWLIQNPVVRWFAELTATQCVLTIALLPIMVFAFGQISLVGFIVNLIAVPWITLLVTPLALLGMIFSPLWNIAAWVLEPLLAILHIFAQWPHAALHFAQAPQIISALSLLGLMWLMLPVGLRLRALAVPLWLPALLWQPARPAAGEFAVDVFDVGQGSAAMVRTASHTLLFDAGPRWSDRSDAGESIIVPNARALGIERLDALVLSHGDADHAGGASSVLQALPTRTIFAGAGVDKMLNYLVPHAKTIFDFCERGQSWIWDDVHFEFIHPKSRHDNFKNNNAGSCVLRVQSKNNKVAIFTGDIGAREEWEIVGHYLNDKNTPENSTNILKNDWLKSDLLLAPHHGSASGSSALWVQSTRPALVVFQTGFANRWSHPAPVVRARYRAAGATLSNTAFCGALHWHSAHPCAPARCQREQTPHYWDTPAWLSADGTPP